MQNDNRSQMLEALGSDQYKQRIRKARRFEYVEGAGMLKRIERFFTSPSIYVPYLIYAKGGMSRWYSTAMKLFWGRTVRLPLDDYDALILYMYGGLYGSELKLTKFFIKNLGPDDVFYDIGANRGFYTFLASDLCKETHAFEPMAALADAIGQNIRLGEHMTANSMALSDTNGVIDFYVMESTMLNTINPSVAGHDAVKKVTVPTATIDTYVATHAKPTFLKIDAEGAEERIIKGGSEFFSSNSPVIAMEVWGQQNGGEMSMSAADHLRAMGYRSYRLDDEGVPQEITGNLSEGVAAKSADNFIFKK
jgi:FkbM family methyltransferase